MNPPASLRWLGSLVVFCGIGAASQALAQVDGTRPDFAAAAERAEREGNKVFKWVLMHGDKPKPPDPPKPAAPAKPAVRTKAAPSASRPKEPERPPAGAAQPVDAASPGAETTAAAQAPASAPLAVPPAAAEAEAVSPPAAASQPPASEGVEEVAPAPAPAPDEPQQDQPLVLVRQVEPDYPLVVVRRIKEGSVQLSFEVQPDGSVASIEVVESSNPRLNAAAIDALAQWKFQPLRRAQTGMVKLEFDFR